MTNAVARNVVTDASTQEDDQLARTTSLPCELEEALRNHIQQNLKSWLFLRKLAADCSRSNISLHGFSRLWERLAAERLAGSNMLEKYLIDFGGRSYPANIDVEHIEWSGVPDDILGHCKVVLSMEEELSKTQGILCSLVSISGNNDFVNTVQVQGMQRKYKHVKDVATLVQQVERVYEQPARRLYSLDKALCYTDGIIRP